jgi:hypothetical protein
MKHLAILRSGKSFRKINWIGKAAILVVLLFFQPNVLAQKKVTHQELIWYGYYNTLKFNKSWIVNSEIQERQFINPSAQHQLVFRSSLQRNLGENWNASVGMTYFLQSPQDSESESNLIVPELRPNIGFDNKQKLSFGTISHRYKAEARFFHDVENDELIGGYRFSNYRLRYQFGFDIQLIKEKSSNEPIISMKVKDEVMFNVGRKIVKNSFDQNRIYLGLNYKLNPFFSVEAGYMNWFQQRASGTDYYNRDIVRLSLFHTIVLKNK